MRNDLKPVHQNGPATGKNAIDTYVCPCRPTDQLNHAVTARTLKLQLFPQPAQVVDGRVAGHLGDAVGLKTLSIHVCVCPHFGM